MQAPIRRRLSLRGAPGVVSEGQYFVAEQVPSDVLDPKQAAWNARQWRELEARLQGGGAIEQALLDLEARVAALEADIWDFVP